MGDPNRRLIYEIRKLYDEDEESDSDQEQAGRRVTKRMGVQREWEARDRDEMQRVIAEDQAFGKGDFDVRKLKQIDRYTERERRRP